MYAEDFAVVAYIVIVIAFFIGFVVLIAAAVESDNKHEENMRTQYAQCVKDGKEWVLTRDYGLDGVCVSKR
jgi:hypothetical protein